MIKRILFATGTIAVLAAPAAMAGENCHFGHSRDTAQTAQSDATLPQSTPVDQAEASAPAVDDTTETTVASVTSETQ